MDSKVNIEHENEEKEFFFESNKHVIMVQGGWKRVKVKRGLKMEPSPLLKS